MRPPLTLVEQRNQALKQMREEEGFDILAQIWYIAQMVVNYCTGAVIVTILVAGIIYKIF